MKRSTIPEMMISTIEDLEAHKVVLEVLRGGLDDDARKEGLSEKTYQRIILNPVIKRISEAEKRLGRGQSDGTTDN